MGDELAEDWWQETPIGDDAEGTFASEWNHAGLALWWAGSDF